MSHRGNMRSSTAWGKVKRNQQLWHDQKEFCEQKYLRFGVISTMQWMM